MTRNSKANQRTWICICCSSSCSCSCSCSCSVTISESRPCACALASASFASSSPPTVAVAASSYTRRNTACAPSDTRKSLYGAAYRFRRSTKCTGSGSEDLISFFSGSRKTWMHRAIHLGAVEPMWQSGWGGGASLASSSTTSLLASTATTSSSCQR